MGKENLAWVYVLLVICLLVNVWVLGSVANINKPEVDLTDTNTKLTLLTTKVDSIEEILTPEVSEDGVPYDPLYTMTKSEYEEEQEEKMAEILALESIDSRDFKRAVFDVLVAFNQPIESYKHITEIKYDFDVDGDEVDFDRVKVYFYIDDDDEEEYKAKLDDFTVVIEDLDFDDGFEDAEVDEDYFDNLEVLKVYER